MDLEKLRLEIVDLVVRSGATGAMITRTATEIEQYVRSPSSPHIVSPAPTSSTSS